MHKKDLFIQSIKKEFLDLINNRISILLFFICASFIVFQNRIPKINSMITGNPSKVYIILSFVFCIFYITQFLYDGFKRDFSSGGIFFILNCKIPVGIYLFGKKIVSCLLISILILLRVKDFIDIFSWKDYLWIFLFFVFVVNNTFLFSILFYSPNTNFIAYMLIFVFPVLLLCIFLSFKLQLLKSLILLLINVFIKRKLIRAWYSRKFRIPLKSA